jgi:osmotically-inducible protein OsmY
MRSIKSSGFDLGAVKAGALAVRDRIRHDASPAEEAKSTAKKAGHETRSTVGRATERARKMAGGLRKGARRQYVRGRVAATRATSGKTRTSKKSIAAAGAAGAAGAYFLDPNEGRRRRHLVRDRALALGRKAVATVRRQTEHRKQQAEGKVEALKSKARPEKPAANDQQLAERVKSEIFQPADAPKGSVNVNVERGIVYLRGEVEQPDQIRELVKQAGSVDGVAGVENLLHAS